MAAAKGESLSSAQISVFGLTYIAYIVVYFTRKPLSVSKSTLKAESVHTEDELGAIDTAFLITYAIAQLCSGLVCSVTGPRFGLVLCFIGTGICAIIFGSADDKSVRSWTWMINGVFQAMFFPFIISILNSWFPPTSRGRVFGLWTTCQQVGGFATSAFGAWVLAHEQLTWHAIFVWPAYLAFVLAVACLVMLEGSPRDAADVKRFASKPKSALSFFEVLGFKNLMSVGAGYFCIKLVRYIFLGWLPVYLNDVLKYSAAEAVLLSTAFDIAGAVGSIGCGFISDKVFGGKSVIAVVPLCLLCGTCAALYPHIASYGKVANIVVMSAVGFAVAGPDSVLGGAACAEVCDKAGHPTAVTTASGFSNGMGSVGAIASGMLPIIVKRKYGWDALFMLLGGLSAAGALCILPMAMAGYSEISGKEDKKTKKSRTRKAD